MSAPATAGGPSAVAPAAPVVLVAAVARNGVIGDGAAMPWHLPEDLAHFRRLTSGCPVIMGRRTWESLPARFRPLPGRRNIVLSRSSGFTAPGAEVARGLDEALAMARTGDPHGAGGPREAPGGSKPAALCVIGGAQVYAEALPRADRLELTEIDADFAGATRFPERAREAFQEVRRERLRAAPPNDFDIAFVTYERRQRGVERGAQRHANP